MLPLARCHLSPLQARRQWGLGIESLERGYVFTVAMRVVLVITYSGWCCDTECMRSLDTVGSDQQYHFFIQQFGFKNHIMFGGF